MAIVETRYGKVEGAINSGIHSFKGIPFAAPPVGEKRWRAPEPPLPWAGVRAANGDWGKQAWQVVTDNPNHIDTGKSYHSSFAGLRYKNTKLGFATDPLDSGLEFKLTYSTLF